MSKERDRTHADNAVFVRIMAGNPGDEQERNLFCALIGNRMEQKE